MKTKLAVLASGTLVLVLAMALNASTRIARFRAVSISPPKNIGASVELAGWQAKVLPLGDTETLSSSIKDALAFDWFLYKSYSRDGVEFSVYAAGWGAGKVAPHMVESHTPDHCWVLNGWRCRAAKEGYAAAGLQRRLTGGSWRLFSSPNDVAMNVAFWHFVGGSSHNYGQRSTVLQHGYYWVRDALSVWQLAGKPQLFVRIASRSPLEEILAQREVAILIDQLAESVGVERSI